MDTVNDKFLDTGGRGTLTTLQTPGHSIGGTSINLVSPTNWSNGRAVPFSMRRVNVGGVDDGKEIAGSYTEWIAILNGSSLDGMILMSGNDQAYAPGSATQVMIHVSTTWSKRLIEGLLIAHNRNGTLKQIATATIADNAVTTAKLADSSVTNTKLAQSAIFLGYSQITSSFVTRSTTPIQVPGLSVTANVPAGRRQKVTFYCGNVYAAGTPTRFHISIWDGPVNTGTQVQSTGPATSGNTPVPGIVVASIPALGTATSKTYNIGFRSENGGIDCVLECTSTSPAYVELEVR